MHILKDFDASFEVIGLLIGDEPLPEVLKFLIQDEALPPTSHLAGSLCRGMDIACPFYHERQRDSHCGMHVVNMLIGHAYWSPHTLKAMVKQMMVDHANATSPYGHGEFYTPSGDYDQT